MATIDRFKDALAIGKILTNEETSLALTAQMKYDYLAAVHTMEQLTGLIEELKKRKKHRADLQAKLSNTCKLSMKKLVESDEVLTLKQIAAVSKVLKECHDELLKIESSANESERLWKLVADGVSAGH